MEPRNVAAMIHRHNSVSNRIRGGKTEPLPSCHSEQVKRAEESSQVANFILWWFFHQRGGFLHSADAAVGMTYRGVVPFCLHGLYLQRFMAMNHRRYIGCTVIFGSTVHPHGVLFATPPERHTGRSLRFRWWVVPFNRTGCIRNAAGG